MINGRKHLHVVANGTMTGQRYIEVLLPHVHLFRGAVGDKFVFMDDNATCHRTLAVQDCLDSEGIQRLVWPARSPDLNPIENVWDALGRQVAGRNYPPTNKNTLIRALTEEWDKLPQQLLDNVVQREKLPIQAIRGLFEETVEHDFQNFHIMATDASKNDQIASTAGITENLSFTYRINHNNSIFTAEALAICQALDDLTVPNKNLLMLSDSLSVLHALQNYSIKSHSAIHRLANKICSHIIPIN
ncbi:transposable element Tcb1 transposase [Trichonephila clavipes]|nr:transposable element Tcb1 transposase [Trichonephila clavipes]